MKNFKKLKHPEIKNNLGDYVYFPRGILCTYFF